MYNVDDPMDGTYRNRRRTDTTSVASSVSCMESQREFRIALCIYGQVSFEPCFKLLIDTEPMQRLRRVMQLGFCTYVWPDATHTRFVHSLGTAFLVRKLIQSLRANGHIVPPNHEFGVIVAMMLHDLGHGPFSHSFETVANELLRESGDDRVFRHEDMSIKLFNYILENYPDVADMIRDRLGDELNTEFIEALIDPPENLFDENNHIIIKGLENKDAYLFSIVSNKHSGLDVDKLDYIVRDSLMTNVNVSVNADRIITGVHTEEFSPDDHKPKRTCLVFDKKIMSDIRDMFQARIKLHEICYYHKTVMITEYLYSKALKLALPHLSYKNAKGDDFNFFDALFDPSAFLRLDDSIISRITNHLEPNEDLLRAESLIHQAECRNHPRIVSRVFLDTLVGCRRDGRPVRSLRELRDDLQELVRPFDGIVLTKSVDAGKGVGFNPLLKVLVKPRNGTKVKYSDKVLPLTDMGYGINVYCPLSESPPADEINATVRDFFSADIEVSFEQRA